MLPFDGEKLINSFDENTYLIYKLHPLLKNVCLPQHPRIIDMFNEDTHELFALSDLLISDFSSIVFDYSILNKTMYFYVPDLNDYLKRCWMLCKYRFYFQERFVKILMS